MCLFMFSLSPNGQRGKLYLTNVDVLLSTEIRFLIYEKAL